MPEYSASWVSASHIFSSSAGIVRSTSATLQEQPAVPQSSWSKALTSSALAWTTALSGRIILFWFELWRFRPASADPSLRSGQALKASATFKLGHGSIVVLLDGRSFRGHYH